MLRILAITWTIGWSLAAAVFGWFFHEFYWRWRDCFNEEGRCFVEKDMVVHHDEAGPAYGVLIAVCALLAIAGVLVAFRRRPAPNP